MAVQATSATGGYLSPVGAPVPEDGALDAIVQAFVAGVTRLPGNLVRPRWQLHPPSMPEVGTNWCALGIIDEEGPGGQIISQHWAQANNGLGQTFSVEFDIVTFLASFYGPGARGYAKLFRDGVMIAQNREKLQLLGIALVEMPRQMMFIPEIVNLQTQRRADIRFRLNIPSSRTWEIENLLTAQATIFADDGSSVSITVSEQHNASYPAPGAVLSWVELQALFPPGQLYLNGGIVMAKPGSNLPTFLPYGPGVPWSNIGGIQDGDGVMQLSALGWNAASPTWTIGLPTVEPDVAGYVFLDGLIFQVS
jgi:hypothetical protein